MPALMHLKKYKIAIMIIIKLILGERNRLKIASIFSLDLVELPLISSTFFYQPLDLDIYQKENPS